MAKVDYRFTIELFCEDGSLVGQAPVSPDWEPAIEWTHFNGVRRGRLPEMLNANPATNIEPIWDQHLGEPYVDHFRVVISANDGGVVCGEIPKVYLRDLAREASLTWVEQGRLRAHESFQYRVCAYSSLNGGEVEQMGGFSVEEVSQPLQMKDSSLIQFVSESQLSGNECVNEEDVPVFIPQRVLAEAVAATMEAGELETGGVLVGLLHRDRRVPEIFIEVTAQIPASHAEAQQTKLTFTAETWTAVHDAINLRRQNEIMLGWWHSHPDFCKKCPAERQAVCAYQRPFFSREDCTLHRTVFGRAFNIGLLLSHRANELTNNLFGWREGMVQARGFHVRPTAGVASDLFEVNKYGTTKFV